MPKQFTHMKKLFCFVLTVLIRPLACNVHKSRHRGAYALMHTNCVRPMTTNGNNHPHFIANDIEIARQIGGTRYSLDHHKYFLAAEQHCNGWKPAHLFSWPIATHDIFSRNTRLKLDKHRVGCTCVCARSPNKTATRENKWKKE